MNAIQFKALWMAVGLVGAVPTVQLVTRQIEQTRAAREASLPIPAPAPVSRQSMVATAPAPSQPERTKGVIGVRLKADSRGHFITNALINRVSVPVVVDTGASAVAMSFETAQKAGLLPRADQFTVPVSTANGIAKAAPIRIPELRIGDIVVTNVEGWVMPRGALSMDTLLGMSFLKRLTKVEMEAGQLKLIQ